MKHSKDHQLTVGIEIEDDEWTLLGAIAVVVLKSNDGSETLSVIDLFQEESLTATWDVSPGRPLGASLLDCSTFVHMKVAGILLRQGRLP